jgi:ABC-type polysaccharide/polyol phosphate transport system ATPase subunit
MPYVLVGEGLTKIYRLYANPVSRLKEILTGKKYHSEYIALKDVSIKVKKGEVVGIIGENGAGKSTLLSILSGVLPPTEGKVWVEGRVASILELGVGFHPDLSGYENVRMYASILGISKEDLKSKMSFIEDFSELSGFLDKPIKTYSTGMVVRLAFSTMLAMEPAVFIIDEALSVGDIHFQYKSFNALRDYRNKGGSIIFTTHSLYQVTSICDRAIWLKHGQIELEGEPLTVVKAFEDYMREKNRIGTTSFQNKEQNAYMKDSIAFIENVTLSSNVIKPHENLSILVDVSPSNHYLNVKVNVGLVFKRNDSLWVTVYSTKHENITVPLSSAVKLQFTFEDFPVLHGEYLVEVYLLDETGTIIYDVKSVPLTVLKISHLDLGVFRIKGKVSVLSKRPYLETQPTRS